MPGRRLVLGIGNDLFGDDGVGPVAVETLRSRPSLAGFDFEIAEGGGLGLIDLLAGYERAYVVDCVAEEDGDPGRLRRLSAEEFAERAVDLSSHYAGLPQVLALGKRLGIDMPHIDVLAVTVRDPYRIALGLTRALRRRLPELVDQLESALLEEDDGHA